mmetsp:Transcript_23725/g.48774  ORF Transcript_23725/g.48774 Transcript_23725/m.48774 type:complete len:97 (+) Transcript_23725:200-490(+)
MACPGGSAWSVSRLRAPAPAFHSRRRLTAQEALLLTTDCFDLQGKRVYRAEVILEEASLLPVDLCRPSRQTSPSPGSASDGDLRTATCAASWRGKM